MQLFVGVVPNMGALARVQVGSGEAPILWGAVRCCPPADSVELPDSPLLMFRKRDPLHFGVQFKTSEPFFVTFLE